MNPNLYIPIFTYNNPIMFTDPEGYNPLLIPAAIQIIRQLTFRYGPRIALAAIKFIKPWLKKVKNEPKKYNLVVEGPRKKDFKFIVKIYKKGIKKPVARVEAHYENGKFELHTHLGTKRQWRKVLE